MYPKLTARKMSIGRQFILMLFCGLAYATPWGIVVAFGRFHMEDIGLGSGVIAGLFSLMIVISIFGRFSASLGDLVSPQKVLAGALLLEALGVAGLLVTTTPALLYICVTLIGIGSGLSTRPAQKKSFCQAAFTMAGAFRVPRLPATPSLNCRASENASA